MPSLSRRAVLAGAAALVPALPAVAQPAPSQIAPFMYGGVYMYEPLMRDLRSYRDQVLHQAGRLQGQAVGGGECTHFVAEVLRRSRMFQYESALAWGVPWNMPAWERGLVMQMTGGARWQSGSNYFYTQNQHTLILFAPVAGPGQRWQVIHQNWNGQRRVTLDTLNFGMPMVSGQMALYQPWPA